MISMTWWAVPAALEVALAICCALVGNVKEAPGAPIAAAGLFVLGSMVIGALAFACYCIAG